MYRKLEMRRQTCTRVVRPNNVSIDMINRSEDSMRRVDDPYEEMSRDV